MSRCRSQRSIIWQRSHQACRCRGSSADRTAPATELAGYVSHRMRDHRILIGTDGPYDNVLKIRPPLTIEAVDCDLLLSVLAEVLRETSSFN